MNKDHPRATNCKRVYEFPAENEKITDFILIKSITLGTKLPK